MNLLHTWSRHCWNKLLCWALGWVSLCTIPLRAYFVPHSFYGSPGCKTGWFQKQMFCGLLSGVGLKGWNICCGVWTPHSSGGNSWLWVSAPEVGFLARPWLCFSYSSQCGPFIISCGGALHLVFRFFPEGTDPYVAMDFVCPLEEGSSGFPMLPS